MVYKLGFIILLLCSVPAWSQELHDRFKDLPCLNKHFNLHLHIGVDSLRKTNFDPAQMDAPIEQANHFFKPICVSFSVCAIDTMLNYNFDSLDHMGEAMEIISHHQSLHRLNVYVLENLLAPPQCGFAGSDHVFLKKACPSALTHELGHVFGLLHTFETGDELVDGSNSASAGDKIQDTPADPFFPDPYITWHINCEFVWEGRDANGQYYMPGMGNIMSYYGCDCGFTRDQYLKMVATINSFSKRFW